MRSGYHDTDQSQSTKQKSHIYEAGTIRVRFGKTNKIIR
jgi:hypothetical protein